VFLSYSHLFSRDSRYVIFILLNIPFNETYDVFLVSPCPKQFHEESKTCQVPPISIHRHSRNFEKCNYHKCETFNAKELSARSIMQMNLILSKEKYPSWTLLTFDLTPSFIPSLFKFCILNKIMCPSFHIVPNLSLLFPIHAFVWFLSLFLLLCPLSIEFLGKALPYTHNLCLVA